MGVNVRACNHVREACTMPTLICTQYLCMHRDAIFRHAYDIYIFAQTPVPLYIETFQITTTSFSELRSNARRQPLPEAGARHERTLEAVGCTLSLDAVWIMSALPHSSSGQLPEDTWLSNPILEIRVFSYSPTGYFSVCLYVLKNVPCQSRPSSTRCST